MDAILEWFKTVFSSSLVIIFSIAALGYLLGSFSIKGLSLGTSGVLLVALVFGHFGLLVPSVVKNLGLICFVTAVGFIAGPGFFRNFKKNAISYVLLGIAIILVGAATCIGVIKLAGIPTPLSVGMMSGALTSTPGLAAAIEATKDSTASVGYGIAYPFGVVGVVLFVQLIPKLLKIDIAKERERLMAASQASTPTGETLVKKNYKPLDEFGLFAFAVAAILGVMIGKISIPLPGGAHFSLGTSGGPLLAGLVMGHFAHVGPVAIDVPKRTLEVVREVGLALFLMGAGTEAGQGFLEILGQYGVQLFLLGAVMTILPMIVGYILATKVFKIDVLSSLGSICGGMTSTPALGTLMAVTKCEAVAVSYAATYPLALIMVVLCCEFIPILF
ncbi:MAG: permease [Oscillospiraceae bacterium]|nr:permease [Oscillospiraceae bacterium]